MCARARESASARDVRAYPALRDEGCAAAAAAIAAAIAAAHGRARCVTISALPIALSIAGATGNLRRVCLFPNQNLANVARGRGFFYSTTVPVVLR